MGTFVSFFLILEANPAFSALGLNKPSASISAYLVAEKSFLEEETKNGIN